MKALILAAGLGTRLAPFTDHTPKPLFTLHGRPVIDLTIAQLQQAGCAAIMVNTHHHHDQIETFLAGQAYGANVRTRHEAEILGTGGAIRNIADFWTDAPLLVINADIVSDIDLKCVYDYHLSHSCPVTMVMHDRAQFNTVAVDTNDFVLGFDPMRPHPATARQMAFTGIHVLDRRVLDFLPPDGPAHIIDAYAGMLAAGEQIKALVVRNHYWQDIGTPVSYKATAFDHMAPAAFAQAFGRTPAGAVLDQPIEGDGSDRQWHRLTADGHTLIMVDHGIRTCRDSRQEVDAFVDIGRHLHASGACVPAIYLHDTFSGLVFLEDLGTCHLQQAAQALPPMAQEDLYRQVIDLWLHMALESAHHFDTGWTYQSTHYSRELILERECRYFVEAFFKGYLGLTVSEETLSGEFDLLAELALQNSVTGFMHRDLQSRNIMVRDKRIGFIDFQGGRLGPLQYDLASLLIDPYIALPEAMQQRLAQYAAQALQRLAGVEPGNFLQGYDYCALTRNLQMLGAFGFLSRVKGKRRFEIYIPRAVATLQRRLNGPAGVRLPRLTAMAAQIVQHLARITDPK